MKKFLCFALAAMFMLTMSISGFCAEFTPEEAGGATVITTSVPSEHKITVHYNSGGYIMLNGKICPSESEITVDRFDGINLDVICKKGHHVKQIIVNGEDVTSQFINGTLQLTDVVTDIYVEFDFEDCASDPNDQCLKVDAEGVVYLGDKEVKGADLDFDFGSFSAKTDKDGRYYVDGVAEGRHIVTVTKDGKKLGTCEFVVAFSDDADEVSIQDLPDGTQLVVVPKGTDRFYLDFVIADENGDGIPDVDPNLTDPTIPPEGGFNGSDGSGKGNTGMNIAIGSPKPEKAPPKIPITGELTVTYAAISVGIMLASLFFILLLVFKRKKDEDKEQIEG